MTQCRSGTLSLGHQVQHRRRRYRRMPAGDAQKRGSIPPTGVSVVAEHERSPPPHGCDALARAGRGCRARDQFARQTAMFEGRFCARRPMRHLGEVTSPARGRAVQLDVARLESTEHARSASSRSVLNRQKWTTRNLRDAYFCRAARNLLFHPAACRARQSVTHDKPVQRMVVMQRRRRNRSPPPPPSRPARARPVVLRLLRRADAADR